MDELSSEGFLTKICYFSGTGNTLWSAKTIARIIENEKGGLAGGHADSRVELIQIGIETEKDEIVLEADAVVLLFPSYAYGMPLAVHRFAEKAVFKTPYVAAFVTYGSTPAGTMAGLSRILKKKRINATYFGRIPSVENYIAIFGTQKEKKVQRRLAMQRETTEAAARSVIERKTNWICPFRPLSSFIWLLFSALALKIFYRYYKVSADCNGCGICKKICPVSAITMKENRPVFSSKCEHCQGCLNWCPKRAIGFGRMTIGTPGYSHPEITLNEMARKN